MRSTEEYRRGLRFRVQEAIAAGHRVFNISMMLTNGTDGMFVSKLFADHNFKRETLVAAYNRLHLLNAAPKIPITTQRYLTA